MARKSARKDRSRAGRQADPTSVTARSGPGTPREDATPSSTVFPPAKASLDGITVFLSERPRLLGWLLFLTVLAVFLPVIRHEFICYDDNGYVTQNRWLKAGFTWANIGHAFRTTEIAYWHPLTWMSHMLDVELFGLQAWGHHLTSTLFHAANALLVFVVLRKMTGAVWRSWFIAALFGLHPLHVESVAWVAERKDVLSTFFWLLAVWSYVHWTQQKAAQRPRAQVFYALSLLSFAAGLMSKPMVVTLPCLLLLLDYWPLNRWGRKAGGAGAAPLGQLLLEKIPFLILSVADSIVTVGAQADLGTLQTVAHYPLTTRVLNALVSYYGYLEKCFYPVKLAVFYPYPIGQPVGPVLVAVVVLAGLSIVAAAGYRKRPYLLAGWLWYLGTLVPVIGLVQVGGQAMADRYSYVPLVGIFIILAWGAEEVTRGWTRRALLLVPAAGAALAALTGLTCRQLTYWQDNPALFGHALAVTENNWCAHSCLGYHYAQSPSRLDEAVAEYRETVRLAPSLVDGHYSLGALLARKPGGLDEAVTEFQTALRLDPRHVQAHVGLGQALVRIPGRLADAVAVCEDALRLDPDSSGAHISLAYALALAPERLTEAAVQYRAALKLEPDSASVHYSFGTVLARMPVGLAEAVSEYQTALRINPRYVEAHIALGMALARIPGRLPEAITEYEAALRLEPDNPVAHINLGDALAQLPGRLSEAIAQYHATLKLTSDSVEAHYALGTALARTPDGLVEAVSEYQTALRISPNYPLAHLALGKALVRIPGGLANAVAECEAAVRLMPEDPDAHLNLGDALAQLPDRLADAIAEYRSVLRLRPDWAEVHSNLGIVLAQIPGRMRDAIAEYEVVIRAKPSFAEAHNNLANVLIQAPGRSTEAITEYETAIRLRPDFFEAEYNLGQFLVNFPDRIPEAITHFEAALKIKPDLEPARVMLARLRAGSR